MKKTLVAALAVCAVALSGCGSSGDKPGHAPRKPSTAAIRDPAGNKALAQVQSQHLAGLMPLPPGSTRYTGVAPKTLAGPATGTANTPNLIDTTMYWRVPAAVDVLQWATAHRPPGFVVDVTASGTDSAGISFTAPKDPAAPENEAGTLAVSAAIATATSSATSASASTLWRIDGEVVWYDPTPVKVTPTGKHVHLTISGGCPAALPVQTGITNSGPGLDDSLLPPGDPTSALVCQYGGMNPPPAGPGTKHWTLDAAQARAVAGQVRHLRVGSSGGVYNCPMDDGRFTVVVFAMPQGDIDIVWKSSGCESVSNGHIIALMGSLALPA